MFILVSLLAKGLGGFASLPISLYDLFLRRFWLWGSAGALFALTPFVVARVMAELAAEQKGILFD